MPPFLFRSSRPLGSGPQRSDARSPLNQGYSNSNSDSSADTVEEKMRPYRPNGSPGKHSNHTGIQGGSTKIAHRLNTNQAGLYVHYIHCSRFVLKGMYPLDRSHVTIMLTPLPSAFQEKCTSSRLKRNPSEYVSVIGCTCMCNRAVTTPWSTVVWQAFRLLKHNLKT